MRHATKLLLAGFGLAGVLALGASSARAQTKTVSGAGTGAWVRSAGIVTQAASAAMPDGGGQASDDLTGVSLGGLLSASAATAVTAGEGGADRASAQTVSSAGDLNVLNGLIRARRVVAVANAVANGDQLASDTEGSGFAGLVVNGLAMGDNDYLPAPNTRVDLLGVGYVILNERTASATGVGVNMIHVVLLSGGEIVVGAASSGVGS